jgi:hypothetical protein
VYFTWSGTQVVRGSHRDQLAALVDDRTTELNVLGARTHTDGDLAGAAAAGEVLDLTLVLIRCHHETLGIIRRPHPRPAPSFASAARVRSWTSFSPRAMWRSSTRTSSTARRPTLSGPALGI